ncbi:MAG: ABC transporter permease [Spirochaetes bacterium]|nr:ABC transporter permease [Spirochaetota bacterium]
MKTGKPRLQLKILLFTLISAATAACVLLLAFAPDFAAALGQFFVAPFSNGYYFGNILAGMAPLIVAGLGVAVAFSSRNFNLGGEGQIYAGGLAAALAALVIQGSPFWVSLLAFAAAAVTGGILGGFSGFLKRRLGIDELISSFLISAITVLAVDYLISGPFRDGSSNFQTTAPIGASLAFAKLLPPSSLSAGIFIALAAAAIGKLVFDKTRFGFELKLCGTSREFARYAGIDGGFYTTAPLALSGALHGIAGALLVFGSYGAAIKGFSSGTGWNAIAVALIARNDPAALLPAAFFYSYLETGAQSVQLGSDISSEMIAVVQAVILLFVTARSLPFTTRKKAAKQ